MMEYRNDNDVTQDCKQVEFNTFASGAGGVISSMTDVHRSVFMVADFYHFVSLLSTFEG
jgi:hypothetical protein